MKILNTFLKSKINKSLSRISLYFTIKDSDVVRKIKENRKGLLSATVLIAGTITAHILNLVFTIFLYRSNTVSLSTVSIISLLTSLFSLIAVPISAIQAALTHQTAILDERFGNTTAYLFLKRMRNKALLTSLFISLTWLASSRLIMQFFQLETSFPILLFTPILFFSLIYSIDRGYMSGKLMFSILGFLVIIEPLIKLITAVILVATNLNNYVYLAIPVSFITATFIGWLVLPKLKSKSEKKNIKQIAIPYKFFSASLLSGLAGVGFLSVDVILANHYLTPVDAGKYALVSLVGKMIYFLGGLSTQFVLPLVSRYEGKKKNSQNILYLSFLSTALLSGTGFVIFVLFANYSLPLLLAAKAEFVYPHVFLFSLGMLCFTLSRVFVIYYLSRKIYLFSISAFLLTTVQITLITFRHSSLPEFISNMSIVGVLHLLLATLLHFGFSLNGKRAKSLEINMSTNICLPEVKYGVWGCIKTIIFNLFVRKNTLNTKEDYRIPGYTYKKIKHIKGGSLAHTALIYKNKKHAMIVKYLHYAHKTSEYYQALNEVNTLALLQSFRVKTLSGLTIRFPKLLNFSDNGQRVRIEREFVPGKDISTYSSSYQLRILQSALEALNVIQQKMQPEKMKGLAKRTPIQALIVFPIYFILSVVKEPALLLRLTKSALKYYSYQNLAEIIAPQMVISHRDLHGYNMVLNKNVITIIDSEIMVQAEKETDLAYAVRLYSNYVKDLELINLLNNNLHSSEQKARFLRLTLFYTFQAIATLGKSHFRYSEAISYLNTVDRMEKNIFMTNTNNKVHVALRKVVAK